MTKFTLEPEKDGNPAYWYNEQVFDEVRARGEMVGGPSYDFDSFGALWEVAKMVTERDVKIQELEGIIDDMKNDMLS